MNEPFLEDRSTGMWIIEAICINCNKQFKSMRAVRMHLKVTAARQIIIRKQGLVRVLIE